MPTAHPRASKLSACPDCDLLLQTPQELEGPLACPDCGAYIYRAKDSRPELALALLVTAVIVFLLSNVFPVVTLEAAGMRSTATLWQTVQALEAQGMLPVAMLVLLTGVVMPVLELGTMLYIRLPLWLGRAPPGFARIIRMKSLVHPWCMVEVYLMGVLVSLVKLVGLATIHPGMGLWALFALILLMAVNASRFNPEELWEQYQACRATA